MKLRIRGNSIRLRLSQQDVKVFGEKGRVEDSIQFGASAGGQLTYVLASAEVKKIKNRIFRKYHYCFCSSRIRKNMG